MLLEASPSAAAEADALGYTPLHCAARAGACLAVVIALAAAAPEAAKMRSANGATPLHVAAACGAPLDVVKFLLVRPKIARALFF